MIGLNCPAIHLPISSVLINAQANIATRRNRYNEAVQAYDQTIFGFSGLLYAGFCFKPSVPFPDAEVKGKTVSASH